MKTLLDLFNIGMARNYQDIIPSYYGSSDKTLNLGPGSKKIHGAIELDLPQWDAERDPIPYPDNSIYEIHAYHFLEHIHNIVPLMKEIRRVLIPEGHINIVVPYFCSLMQHNDLDHKRSFTEKTWQTLFDKKYYTFNKVEPMEIVTNMIMGDCYDNLCLVTQLRKPKK